MEREASDFSHKKEGVDKIEGLFKKEGVELIFTLTFSSIIFRVFDVPLCVLFIYTISISIVCVSWEEITLIESNQKIYDFYN